MRIIVTGAGGFVGRALVQRLQKHEVVALDHIADGIPALPHVTAVPGDFSDPEILQHATTGGCDAVVHLATVPGGAAEQDPELAWRINMDASMALAKAAAEGGNNPRFVFASSIAVFGHPLPSSVDDKTPLAPKMLYGAHKAMMEQRLATLTRRGAIDAISLRLSGVVARPRGPSGMKSSFLSDVFHALDAGDSFEMPVSARATSWLTSLECAASNFEHALTADLTSAPKKRSVTLPTLRVQVGDLVEETCRQTGTPVEQVRYLPNESLEKTFGALPEVSTNAARALGFVNDSDRALLVTRALESIRKRKTN